jgi:hypothetical protein
MKKDSGSDPSRKALRRWRCTAILFITTTASLLFVLMGVTWLAVQPLDAQYNLYYLLWKAGIRPYDRTVVFSSLFYDQSCQQRFLGVTVNQFQQKFPNTFYKVRKLPPSAKPNQEYYIDNFQQAESEECTYGFCWLAIFEDGRLIEFGITKG